MELLTLDSLCDLVEPHLYPIATAGQLRASLLEEESSQLQQIIPSFVHSTKTYEPHST